ncbi:MAG TPA: cadmium resistance transporter [Cyanophyceae cyanobacterium]
MSELVTAIPTGVAAFAATNLDDIVILTLFFAQVNATFRCRHIVTGQYLGFATLVLASLPGFLGTLLFPHSWLKLLGFVPIFLGISSLFSREEEDDSSAIEEGSIPSNSSAIASFLSPQTYGVAAITVANGSDNIGIYVPLFASSELEGLLVTVSVFFLLVGVWCFTAYKLTSVPAIANLLTGYGNDLVPCVLIGLGVFIIKENIPLTLLAFAASYLCLVTLDKTNERVPAPEVEKN